MRARAVLVLVTLFCFLTASSAQAILVPAGSGVSSDFEKSRIWNSDDAVWSISGGESSWTRNINNPSWSPSGESSSWILEDLTWNPNDENSSWNPNGQVRNPTARSLSWDLDDLCWSSAKGSGFWWNLPATTFA